MKGYVKDANGKFHLVDKPEPQVIINQDPVKAQEKTLSKKDLEKLKTDINKAFDAIMSEAFN